jgi:hypothetical protein
MWAFIIIFLISLLALGLLIGVQALRIKKGKVSTKDEFDLSKVEDAFFKKVKRLAKITKLISKALVMMLIFKLVKTWAKVVGNVNAHVRRKYPHISYVLGEKPKTDIEKTAPSSEFLSSVKEHKEEIRRS